MGAAGRDGHPHHGQRPRRLHRPGPDLVVRHRSRRRDQRHRQREHRQRRVTGYNGTWWYLDFDAPDGQTLTAGTTYADATRYPFNGSGPGLAIYGEGRGCNTLTGSFTVDEAVFGGPDSSYIQDFVVTFEQHCEGGEPARRGTLSIHNPPAPEPLELGLTVAGDGTVSRVTGRATVHGTVTCSEPVTVQVAGTLTQVKKKTILSGPPSTEVACTPGALVDWQAVAPRTAPPRSGRATPRSR